MYLHNITNENALVAKKFGFFCDYFVYCTEAAGVNDLITFESPLSLIQKTIIQIESNPKKYITYVDEYLKHPLLKIELLDSFPTFKIAKSFIVKYINTPHKNNQRLIWVKENPEFLKSLIALSSELKEKLFGEILKRIRTFLKCDHSLEEHKEAMILLTKILVSEFLLVGHSKKDTKNILRKLFKHDEFPLPPEIAKTDDQTKKTYLDNLNFDSQIQGIQNEFEKDLETKYFIFRIVNLKTKPNFEFEYHNVKFVSSKHNLISKIVKEASEKISPLNFFDDPVGLIALVKLDYYSVDVAYSKAFEFAKEGIIYINASLKVNGSIDPYMYLQTTDFEIINGGGVKGGESNLEEGDTENLNDNSYSLLKDVNPISKDDFLKHESIFMSAYVTKNPATYWQYLEVLFPTGDIVKLVPKLLLVDIQLHNTVNIKNYIFNAIHLLSVSGKFIGLTKEQQVKYHTEGNIDIEEMNRDVIHDFIKHLLHDLNPFTENDYLVRKHHYKRIVIEAMSERNFFFHQGTKNEKALILLEGTLPRLVWRLRIIIANGLKEHSGLPFYEIIQLLKSKADTLLGISQLKSEV